MEKTTRQNRVKEALGKIYDQHPPYFREYLRRFKEDPTSRVFAPLAEAYRRLGRIEEAIEICLEGLEHHPDFHGGRVTLAKCYIDRKKFSQAREALERVVQFSPENLLAERLLGDVYVALGERERALHAYQMALLLAPNDVQLSEKVRALEKGEALEGMSPVVVGTDSTVADEQAFLNDFVRDDSAFSTVKNDSGRPTADATSRPSESELLKSENSIDSLLGAGPDLEESFKTEHVSHVFGGGNKGGKQEITTSTLGDLYFSQGQYDRALQIFEKLNERHPHQEIIRKINLCRMKLGVDKGAVLRHRQIELLKGLLIRVREEKPSPSKKDH